MSFGIRWRSKIHSSGSSSNSCNIYVQPPQHQNYSYIRQAATQQQLLQQYTAAGTAILAVHVFIRQQHCKSCSRRDLISCFEHVRSQLPRAGWQLLAFPRYLLYFGVISKLEVVRVGLPREGATQLVTRTQSSVDGTKPAQQHDPRTRCRRYDTVMNYAER